MSATTKADLAHVLHKTVGLPKRKTQQFVEGFFEMLTCALENGEIIKLANFGVLGLRDKNARPGRNPKTGLEVMIDKRRIVVFRASENLKNGVRKLPIQTEGGKDK